MVKKSNVLTKSPRPKFLNLVEKPQCTASQLCPKCSLFLVIRHRFEAFGAQFGREPKATEPLFFDPSKSRPVKASLSDARRQIEAAATAVGVEAAPILRLLKLDSTIRERKAPPIGRSPVHSVTNGARSGVPASRVSTNCQQPNLGSAWERFVRNERLHRLHKVTRQELKTLSGLAMMGEIRNSRDMLYILKLIRDEMEPR